MYRDCVDSSVIRDYLDYAAFALTTVQPITIAVGSAFIRTTEQATKEEINWVLDVNYVGVIRCTKAVIAHMREKLSGHIINVTSVGRLVGQGAYRYQIPAL